MDVAATATLLAVIRRAWGWRRFDPSELVEINAFGNVIVQTRNGEYWRIIPEELSLGRLAAGAGDFEKLRADAEFDLDWRMDTLVAQARRKLGVLPDGRCYHFAVPPVLGGGYDAGNMRVISLEELHSFVGDTARQIDDLPDGAQIQLKITP